MNLSTLEALAGKTNSKPVFGAPPGTVLFEYARHDPTGVDGVVQMTLSFRASGWGDAHSPGDLDGLLSEVDDHAEAPASDTE